MLNIYYPVPVLSYKIYAILDLYLGTQCTGLNWTLNCTTLLYSIGTFLF